MDRSAPEVLTFGLSLRALAALREFTPAMGDRLRLILGGEEQGLEPEGPGDRLCALLVMAGQSGELPPGLVPAVREHLDGEPHLLALSSRAAEHAGTADPPGGEQAEEAFRNFLERWRFERIFRTVPPLAGYGRARIDLEIPSDESLIPGLSHTVGLLLREYGYAPDDWMSTVPLVIDEVLTNAMRHGNRSCREKLVRVRVEVDTGELRLTVSDEGEGFRRDGVADPRQGERLWRAGGRGLFLIEQLMDSVEYRDAGRTVCLVRRRDSRATAISADEAPAPAGSDVPPHA